MLMLFAVVGAPEAVREVFLGIGGRGVEFPFAGVPIAVLLCAPPFATLLFTLLPPLPCGVLPLCAGLPMLLAFSRVATVMFSAECDVWILPRDAVCVDVLLDAFEDEVLPPDVLLPEPPFPPLPPGGGADGLPPGLPFLPEAPLPPPPPILFPMIEPIVFTAIIVITPGILDPSSLPVCAGLSPIFPM